MNILMLVFNQVGKGTYYRAYEFARQLTRLGHLVTIIATSKTKRLSAESFVTEGIKVIASPDLFPGSLRSGWDLYNAISRLHMVKPEEFEIVHGFETRPVVLIPALNMKRAGVPLIWDWADWFGQGGSVEERPNFLVRTILRPVETYFEENFRLHSSATTVICSALKQRAIELHVDPQTIHLVPNGLDSPGWVNYDRANARAFLGFSDDLFLVGYIGSLFPRDALLMANAFNVLSKSYPKVRLIHIGQSNYGIKKMVNAPEKVIESGQLEQNEMARYLAACDLCWLPFSNTNANNGRFPMKLSQYLAAGKPVVSTNVGDIPQYIQANGAGKIVTDNPDKLARMVYNLISQPKILKEMAEASARLAEKPELSWEYRAMQLEDIYRKISNHL